MLALILLGVFIAIVGLAFAGTKIVSKKEQLLSAAGTTEQNMRMGMEPSVTGAMLGIIPFLIFIGALVVMAHAHGEEVARQEAAEAAERAR
jgi:hypothetical protein